MFDLGHIVLNATTGKKGLVVPDMMGCCADWEVPVLYEGSPGFCGTFFPRKLTLTPYRYRFDHPNPDNEHFLNDL